MNFSYRPSIFTSLDMLEEDNVSDVILQKGKRFPTTGNIVNVVSVQVCTILGNWIDFSS